MHRGPVRRPRVRKPEVLTVAQHCAAAGAELALAAAAAVRAGCPEVAAQLDAFADEALELSLGEARDAALRALGGLS